MSSARNALVADGGHPRQQQHGRRLDAAADLGAERAQPHRREQAGVEREEVGAGLVHQPLGRPDLPADPAAHRVVPLAQPAARAAATTPASSSAWTTKHASAAERHRSAAAPARPPHRASPCRAARRARPRAARRRRRPAARQRQQHRGQRRTPPPSTGAAARPARGQSWRATPSRHRGRPGPAARRAAPTASTAEPGGDLGVLPDPGAGEQGAARPDAGARRRPGPARRAARRRRASGR